MSDLNVSALKKHALACSKSTRGGKFTRVGADFIAEVETDVETLVREIRAKNSAQLFIQAYTPAQDSFVTGALMAKVKAALNEYVARIILSKVARQPSVGHTLRRTR